MVSKADFLALTLTSMVEDEGEKWDSNEGGED